MDHSPQEKPVISLSVVVPLRDEAESLPDLHREIVDALNRMGEPYEIIYVDDGSRDGSWPWIHSVEEPSRVIGVRFAGPRGKTAAIWRGFEASRGSILITLDGDGQDVPDQIPALFRQIEEGADFVCGWRKTRSDSALKSWFSRTLNGFIRAATKLPLHDVNCGLKAFRREVVQGIRPVGEAHRSLPILAHWRGFDVREVAVTHRPRCAGRTKYGLTRLLGLAADLIILSTYYLWTTRPRAFFSGVGSLALLLGLAINAYLTATWFLGGSLSNRPLLVLGVLLIIVGIQLVMLGFIGQRIADGQLPPTKPKEVDGAEGERRSSGGRVRRRRRVRAFPRRRRRGLS